jgi:hypothetical protein
MATSEAATSAPRISERRGTPLSGGHPAERTNHLPPLPGVHLGMPTGTAGRVLWWAGCRRLRWLHGGTLRDYRRATASASVNGPESVIIGRAAGNIRSRSTFPGRGWVARSRLRPRLSRSPVRRRRSPRLPDRSK